MDKKSEISRRAFVGALGAGVAGQALAAPAMNGSDAAIPDTLGAIENPQLASIIAQLMSRVAQLEAQLTGARYAGSQPAFALQKSSTIATTPVTAKMQFSKSPASTYWYNFGTGVFLAYPSAFDSELQYEKREINDPGYVALTDPQLAALNLSQTATTSTLTLIHESLRQVANPWAFSTVLTTTHQAGEACGYFSRIKNYGGKNGSWAAGLHSETFTRGPSGSTIGVNVEAHQETGTGRVIGVDIHAVGWDLLDLGNGTLATTITTPKPTLLSEAINIHGSSKGAWNTGVHFTPNEAGAPTGNKAIWIEGQWTTGLDMGSNNMIMAGGAKVAFEQTGQMHAAYNPTLHRIEFRENTDVKCAIPFNASAATGNNIVGLDMGNKMLRMNAGARLAMVSDGSVYITYNATLNRFELKSGANTVAIPMTTSGTRSI
jgi:hypothetical protein